MSQSGWSWANVRRNVAWDDFFAGFLCGSLFTCGTVGIILILIGIFGAKLGIK